MIYVLHHAKGTLVLSADDRDQVYAWSKRQLGNQIGLISNMESDSAKAESLVEKSGTGIASDGLFGCRPVLDSPDTCLYSLQGEKASGFDSISAFQPSARKLTWH